MAETQITPSQITPGTAYQLLGTNSAATANTFLTLAAGSNVSITPSGNTLTLSASGGGSGESFQGIFTSNFTPSLPGVYEINPANNTTLTVSLPDATTVPGVTYVLKCNSNQGGTPYSSTVIINAFSGQTIDQHPSVTFQPWYDYSLGGAYVNGLGLRIMSDGANWISTSTSSFPTIVMAEGAVFAQQASSQVWVNPTDGSFYVGGQYNVVGGYNNPSVELFSAGLIVYTGTVSFDAGAITSNGTGQLTIGSLSTDSGDINTNGSGLMNLTGTLQLNNQSVINFLDSTNSHEIVLSAPTTTAANYNLYLPINQGSANTVLSNDGSGNLSWIAVTQVPTALNLTTQTADTPGGAQDTTSTTNFVVLTVTDATHLIVSSTTGMTSGDTIQQGANSTTITSVVDMNHLIVGSTTGWVPCPTLYTIPTTGLYSVSAYLVTVTQDPGAGNSVPVSIYFTDSVQLQSNTLATGNLQLTGTNSSGSSIIQATAGSALQYSVIDGGTYGAASYDLYLVVQSLV